MKKHKIGYPSLAFFLAVMAIVIFSGIAQAGQVPDGLAGVPWGASKSEVERAMVAKNYSKDGDSKPDIYIYNGEFAGYNADLTFSFINNKFYMGNATFLWRETNHRLLDTRFIDLESQLINKYGNPAMSYRANTGEPWNPWIDDWFLENFEISLYKEYKFTPGRKDMQVTTNGRVTIIYKNKELEKLEKNRAGNRDL